MRAFLPDVPAAGGAVYANALVERIAIADGKAQRVFVRQMLAPGDVREFTVVADTFVVAAGSLRTPGLLARSGCAHPLLGKRLFLHPVMAVAAQFQQRIAAWEGPMQSAYSDAFNGRDGAYGTKLEAAPVHPGLCASALPWEGRATHMERMTLAGRCAWLIALARDRDPGSVDLDAEAQIRYTVSPFDAEHLYDGLTGAVDVAFAAGAERVQTLHAKPIVLERGAWNAAARDALRERLARIGVASNRQIMFSAHQMGTAAMGADPAASVVDPAGRARGVDNLIVADASVFPQASGVNPMLTIMAMARRIAAAHLN